MCQQSFKTHHHLMVHMRVHRGEKFPCSKCGKVLANRRMHARHTASCVQGKNVEFPDCGKQYSSTQGLKQHQKAKHGANILMRALISVLTVLRSTELEKFGLNISPIVRPILIRKVLIFAALLAVLQQTIPSTVSGT